ncbi:MAG: hypothetical protein K2X74_00885 [Acetobacteraceae bacterium]|nr:hypothetical protein [Acetobacteraceae bacterium]
MRRCLTMLLLGLAVLTGGCATRVPLDAQAAASVQRLGVVTPALPDGPTSLLRHSPGLHFGLAGGIADALLQLERQRQLRAALESRGFDVRVRWAAMLEEALRGAGFAVVTVPAPRPETRFLAAYPTAEVDAFLDIVLVSYGYQAAHIAAPFQPHARIRARLATPAGRTLMEEEFQVGPDSPLGFGDLTFVASGTRHAFARSGEAVENPDRVVAGVEEAMATVSRLIAGALRPAPPTAVAAAR